MGGVLFGTQKINPHGHLEVGGVDCALLAERFGTPVELINPFTNIEINPKEFDEEELNQISSSVVIAVGLALRRVGDS